jgi:UDP-glucose 4-epimerase
MKILVTGSAGHLGEALMRTFQKSQHEALGLDRKASPYTHRVGTLQDRPALREALRGVQSVIHTATLHKPHIESHGRQAFIDTNITGTLNLLEEAVGAGVQSFIYTSTTSVFGHALVPPRDAPAAWITENTVPIPKNIYGVTKLAAENLCELFHRLYALPCIILRTSRFFPEFDDDAGARGAFTDLNLKANELLNRRVELEDAVEAHCLAVHKAPAIGFARYIVSATTPFVREDLSELRADAPAVVRRRVPAYEAEYRRRGWSLPSSIDRVYVNALARSELSWQPRYDFERAIDRLGASADFRSPLALEVGAKGYF